MSVEMLETTGTGFLEINLSGKLGQEDYQNFLPRIEEQVREHGKLRLLVHMHDFHGWTPGGLWEDIKFDVKHFKDLERIAFVGDKKWEAGMSKFCSAFTSAETRFFEETRLEAARKWLGTS